MADYELERADGDRRRYVLGPVGSIRLRGLMSRSATAEAGGAAWQFGPSGFWRRDLRATDATGTTVGEFEPRTVRRGGAVRWHGRELSLRPTSSWRERYSLVEDDQELALFDGKGWGRSPVRVTVDDAAAIEPGLLLFAAFIVRRLAEDGNAASAAAASTAATG
jgi:hypothetical protein